jgi:hypothetical protein
MNNLLIGAIAGATGAFVEIFVRRLFFNGDYGSFFTSFIMSFVIVASVAGIVGYILSSYANKK